MLNAENYLEIRRQAEERQLHRMAKVHDFWRCGRAAKMYMLRRKNLALITSRWQLQDTFCIRNRSSKHPGRSFIMMVRLHFNGQKNHLCYQLRFRWTSLEDKLIYWMSTKSGDSTVIQSNVMTIAHLKAIRTPKIGLTGMSTWVIQMTVKTIARQTLNPI